MQWTDSVVQLSLFFEIVWIEFTRGKKWKRDISRFFAWILLGVALFANHVRLKCVQSVVKQASKYRIY